MDIDDIRARLDAADRRIVQAIADRMDVVQEVARLKSEGSVDFLRDREREEALLAKVVELAKEAGVDTVLLTHLYERLLEHSVRLQQEALVDRDNPNRKQPKLVVAYQGTLGSYSHMCASAHFAARDAEVELVGHDSFRAILEAVRDGDADYAVLPIENTTAGSINQAYDLLARMDLALVGEEIQRVDHCLLGITDVPLAQITRAFSHPQALAQCSELLEAVGIEPVKWVDTAGACEKVHADGDPTQVAIASSGAAKVFGMTVLARRIANQPENYTRMVIVAKEARQFDTRIPCKTSVVFATKHQEGALLAALNVLAEHGLNLTKLESRPRPRTPWEYLFYVDFEGNVADPAVQEALRALTSHTNFLKLLGSYPTRTAKETRPARPRPKAVEKPAWGLVRREHRAADTVLDIGGAVFGGEHPVVIAGPASAARQAKEAGAHMLFGGGLDELVAAGEAVGLPVLAEVIDPGRVAAVGKRAHALLVRNLRNEALLDALGRTDRPVVLARDPLSTLDDWLRAADRIAGLGNHQIVLLEAGVQAYERKLLDLAVVPVLRERSHLPVIVDPSAQARWIEPVAEAALAAGAQGLMVGIDAVGEERWASLMARVNLR